jgi:hypothetical protein
MSAIFLTLIPEPPCSNFFFLGGEVFFNYHEPRRLNPHGSRDAILDFGNFLGNYGFFVYTVAVVGVPYG